MQYLMKEWMNSFDFDQAAGLLSLLVSCTTPWEHENRVPIITTMFWNIYTNLVCVHIYFVRGFAETMIFFSGKCFWLSFLHKYFSYCCLDFILMLFQLDSHNWVSPLYLNMFGVFTFKQNSVSINMVQSKVQIIGHLEQILLDTLWTDQWGLMVRKA